MAAQVIPFRFTEARDLRSVIIDNEPWFVAADRMPARIRAYAVLRLTSEYRRRASNAA